MDKINNIRKEMRRKRNCHMTFTVLMVIAVLMISVGCEVAFSFNDTEYIITVTDKERIYTGDGDESSSKYLVFGDDENGNSLVFENTDCLVRNKWNSSNIQGQLKEGNTYMITVVGYRVPFFSMYQNIIKVEQVRE